MNNKKAVYIAILLSISLHLLMFLSFSGIKLEGMQDHLKRSKRQFNVQILRENKKTLKPHVTKRVSPASASQMKFEIPEITKARQPAKTDETFEPLAKKTRASIIPPLVTEPVVLERRDNYDFHTTRNKDYTMIRKKEERKTKSTLVEPTTIDKTININKLDQIQISKDMSNDFVDRMPGFTPAATSPRTSDLSAANTDQFQGYQPLIQREGSRTNLEGLIEYALWTFTDPRDQQKYFKLSLKIGQKADDFPTLKKEIIFLIDSSISIEKDRLEEFKKGLDYALTHLGDNDVFNIKAFKEDVLFFRPHSVEPNKENIRQARKFIGNLTAGEKTDAYSALAQTISSPPAIKPSYILFLSDGRPTQGVTDPTRVISEISSLNEHQSAIFSFSGGLRVNRYLLDFLSYKNRGWAEYSYRTHYIDQNFIQMYDKIREPIMTNLRYMVSGVDRESIYPRILPDFFRNAEFTLYGRYDQEQQIVLQLVGDMKDEIRELFLEARFDHASPGDESIVRNWAFNKIYHLIGLIKYGKQNKDLLDTIKQLSEYFHIQTPYLDNI